MSKKVRSFIVLSTLYVIVMGSCMLYASFQDRVAEEIHGARRQGTSTEYQTGVAATRTAGFCRAGMVLASALFLLVLGVVAAPPKVRLLSGNLIVLICLLLLIEASTQLLGVHVPGIGRPGIAGDFGLWVYDATKGWFHAPSTHAETNLGGPDRGIVRINSLGFRGEEMQPDRPGMKRIVVLGDSYVFGVGVNEENLLTTHLERLLEPYFPGGLEVINLGVSGYSTDQELLLFGEVGPELDPAIVILVVCDNDYVANSENFAWRRYYKPYFDLDDEDSLHLRNVPVPQLSTSQKIKLWLGQESNVWNFVRSRESENRAMQRLIDWFQVDRSRPLRRPYRTTRALVRAFADKVDNLGAGFLVTSTGRRGENPELFESLSRFLSEEGIPHLDLLPALQAGRENEPNRFWDFVDDTHWNRDAHELAAHLIFDTLRARYSESWE